MSALEEASDLVRLFAEPRPAGDSVKAAIWRSAAAIRRRTRLLRGWSTSRVKDIWYADSRVRISGDELNELRQMRQLGQEAKARAEYAALTEFLAPIVQRLDALAADMGRATAHLDRDEFGQAGAADRAVDRE